LLHHFAQGRSVEIAQQVSGVCKETHRQKDDNREIGKKERVDEPVIPRPFHRICIQRLER
jgi:hypothetical protein